MTPYVASWRRQPTAWVSCILWCLISLIPTGVEQCRAADYDLVLVKDIDHRELLCRDLFKQKSIRTKPIVLRGHSQAVFSVAITSDGKTLASASGDNTVKLWDVAAGREL